MNKLLTCTLLACVLAVTTAYDFQDSEYNQILAREWEDLEAEYTSVHPRARRDEEAANKDQCKRRKFKFCCAEESIEAIHETDKPLKKECYKQVTGKDKPSGGFHGHDPFKCDKEKIEKHRREFNCVMQCVGQKKDMLDAQGNLKEAEIKKNMKERFAKDTWLTPKLDAMLDKCLADAKKVPVAKDDKVPAKDDKVPAKDDKDACNGAAMRFAHCFWKELQLSCPADQIKDQKACDRVRERINNHPEFPFPTHRHHDDE